jgi:hypothetical protein
MPLRLGLAGRLVAGAVAERRRRRVLSPWRLRQRQMPFAEIASPPHFSRASSAAMRRGPRPGWPREKATIRSSTSGESWLASSAGVALAEAAPRARVARPAPSSGSSSNGGCRSCGRRPKHRSGRPARTAAAGSRRGRHPATCDSLLSIGLEASVSRKADSARQPGRCRIEDLSTFSQVSGELGDSPL